jgi:hypothetical protein
MPNIRYTFTASGHEAVVTAFAGIRKASAKTSAMVTAHAAKTAGVQMAAMGRVKAAAKATETGKTAAATAGASKRAQATISALQRERSMLRSMLAEYTRFEKMKTATAARESGKRLAAERRNQTRARRGMLGGAARFGGRVARTAGAFLAMGAGVAVAGAAGGAIRENVRLEDMARDIGVRGRDPGGGRVDPNRISAHARRTALAVPGARAVDVMAGTSEFLEQTGDLQKAQEASQVIAEIALATGSDMKDVASSAAALFMQFGTGAKSMEDMREQLGLFVIQGKRGSFEMKDMSKGLRRLAAAAKAAGVEGGIKEVATIGALAQFTSRATGSPQQSVTALEGMFNLMLKKRKLIKDRHGIDVKQIAQTDLASLLPKLFEATGGKEDVLGKMFPKRSISAIIDLLNSFNKLKKETNSGSEAAARLTQKIRDMADAQNVAGEMAIDLADQQKGAGARLNAAWERIVQAFGSGEGLDAINSLIDAIPALLPAFKLLAQGVTWAAESIRNIVYGLAGVLKAMGFNAQFITDVENQRKVDTLRGDAAGKENIARQHERTLQSEYGTMPGDAMPKMLSEEGQARWKLLRSLSTNQRGAGNEARDKLFGIVGEEGMNPAERQLREAAAEARYQAHYKEWKANAPGDLGKGPWRGPEAGLRVGAQIKGEQQRRKKANDKTWRARQTTPEWSTPSLFETLLGPVGMLIGSTPQDQGQIKTAAAADALASTMEGVAAGVTNAGLEDAARNATKALNSVKAPNNGDITPFVFGGGN